MLRYRIAYAVTVVIFFWTYYSQQSTFSEFIEQNEYKLRECERQAAATDTQLKVIWDHKRKLEDELQSKSKNLTQTLDFANRLRELVPSLKTKMGTCEVELNNCKTDLSKLDETHKAVLAAPKDTKNEEKLKEDVDRLQKQLDELKKQLDDKQTFLTKTLEDLSKAQKDFQSCEEKFSAIGGANAVPHYTKNESASFQRNHKAADPLSFDRGNIAHVQPEKLLSGKELVKKLEEEKRKKEEDEKEKNVHPQERNNKDDYVNEVENKEEKDYKEFDN